MPPSKINHRQKLEIIDKYKHGWRIFGIHKELLEQGIDVSYSSVRTVVEKYRTGQFEHEEIAQQRFQAMFRLSVKNQHKRKYFCESLIKNNENFNDAIFSDECTIQVNDNNTSCFQELNGAAPAIPKSNHPLKVHAWAAISRQGTSPILVFDGIMDEEFFTSTILNSVLLPFVRRSFRTSHRLVQDNDPRHTSKIAQQFMEQNNIHWWKWPADSSDLNPMEMVWYELKQHVSEKNPSTKDELLDVITKFWTEEMNTELCNKYIDHIFKVVPVVKALDGKASDDLPSVLFGSKTSRGKSIQYFNELLK